MRDCSNTSQYSSLWLGFDEVILKQLDKRSNADSLINRIVNDLSLNDSNEWNRFPGLPFALNFEANIDGEKQVFEVFFTFIFIFQKKFLNFLLVVTKF
jgi:hypothetical protein